MQITWRSLAYVACVGISLPLVGCSASPTGPSPSASLPPLVLPPPGPEEVKVDSRWNYSAREDRRAANWLLTRARETAGEGTAGLDRLVQRWPDLAVELLRDGIEGDADMPAILAIADSYDRVFGPCDPSGGWYGALNVAAPQRDAYNAFRMVRQQLLGACQGGRFADATRIDIVGALYPGATPALRAEAYRLAGLAELLNDQPVSAATAFASAATWARSGPRHIQFELYLLCSESQRRAGQTAAAAATWRSAVSLGADVRDPDLWERAILIKPADTAWPAQAAIAGAGEPQFAADQPPDTGDVLIGIGKMRLVRGAAQAALLSFSRAETETSVPGKQALARIYRVQSMMVLQLSASALPMLTNLIRDPDPRIAWRAQAIEGDLYCRVLGDRQRGIPVMQAALDSPKGGDWPGKSRLMANLALYDLLEGRGDAGLSRLHAAQEQFESELNWEDLGESLQDEAAYLRAEKSDDAEAVQRHADAICRKAGLPTGPLTDRSSADGGVD